MHLLPHALIKMLTHNTSIDTLDICMICIYKPALCHIPALDNPIINTLIVGTCHTSTWINSDFSGIYRIASTQKIIPRIVYAKTETLGIFHGQWKRTRQHKIIWQLGMIRIVLFKGTKSRSIDFKVCQLHFFHFIINGYGAKNRRSM